MRFIFLRQFTLDTWWMECVYKCKRSFFECSVDGQTKPSEIRVWNSWYIQVVNNRAEHNSVVNQLHHLDNDGTHEILCVSLWYIYLMQVRAAWCLHWWPADSTQIHNFVWEALWSRLGVFLCISEFLECIFFLFQLFTDGTTNKLVGCYVEDSPEDVVLVRVYGNKTELIVDRDNELKSFQVM